MATPVAKPRKLSLQGPVARRLAVVAALAMVVAPAAAQAQTCGQARSEYSANDNEGRRLATDNPGTALVAFGCLAAGQDNYDHTHNESDAVGAFTVCAAFGCGLTGDMQNCVSVGSQLFVLALRQAVLESRLRDLGCGR